MIRSGGLIDVVAVAFLAVAAAGCQPGAADSTIVAGVELSPNHHGPGNAVIRVIAERREVALSFDDGPDPRWTPRYLRLLDRHDAQATFFVVGARAIRYPELVAAELDGGNEVANHTLGHRRLTGLRGPALRRQIRGGARAIVRAGAPEQRFFRPPFGDFDRRVSAAVSASGEVMVGWDVPLDRALAELGPERAARLAAAAVRPGSIILAHDGALDQRRTRAALRVLLRLLDRRGYRVVTVGDLLRHARD